MTIFVLSVCIALGVSFLCSLAEATLLSLTPAQVAEMHQKHPRLGAIWTRLKERIDRPIAIILILNTTAHTIGASFAGASFANMFGDEWIWLFGLIFTFLMLQFTELLPKSLGVHHNRSLALIIGRPLDIAARICRPVLATLHFLNRPFSGKAGQGNHEAKTVDEITALAGMARISQEINSHQEQIISGAARLSSLTARDIMIPRTQVITIAASLPLHEALVVAHIDAHTRYPVLENDRFVGYVNFKEIVAALRTNAKEPSLKGILHPLDSFEATAHVPELLRRFVEQHIHIAQVTGPQGEILGIITMEDIVEELVGELQDEFDRLPRHCHNLSQGLWLMGGGVKMPAVAETCQTSFGTDTGTLSEWILARTTEVPSAGFTLTHDNLQITVRRLRRGKVFEASIHRNT